MSNEFYYECNLRDEPRGKSIAGRIGLDTNYIYRRIDILELPATLGFKPLGLTTPPIPPYVPELEETTNCPRCGQVIESGDPGISYCYRCQRVIIIGDDFQAIEPGSKFLTCPTCSATGFLDDEPEPEQGTIPYIWGFEDASLMPYDLGTTELSCNDCGCFYDTSLTVGNGFQFYWLPDRVAVCPECTYPTDEVAFEIIDPIEQIVDPEIEKDSTKRQCPQCEAEYEVDWHLI